MKLVKMSLVAAMVMGASAFAIDNVKVSGDAKLFYGTDDSGTLSLFDKGNSYADTALRIGVTGDLLKGVSFGLTGYAVSTLGLENNLVSGVWSGAHNVATHTGAAFGPNAQVNDEMWIGEAWLATTMGKTTVKLGRMELDTPLAFSEKWNIAPNTFEAAVVINQDIPDTTLVGAFVGKGNGYGAVAAVVNAGAAFDTFVTDGAYAAAIVNNSYKPLTAQAWYYNVSNIADAFWLQADINCKLVKGLTIGAQYAELSPKNIGLTLVSEDSKAWAGKLGYSLDALKVSVAYSDVADKDALAVANVATGFGQSKLYTEAWWNYGYVGVAGAETVNVTAEYDAGVAKLGAYYTNANNDYAVNDMTEIAVTATKSFGPLDATLAYVSTDADDQNAGSQYNTVQAYLTLNF
ncbi:MAG: porin [Sulfuricurvum sp.]|nr:porin [Sulfuricurvum sp.]